MYLINDSNENSDKLIWDLWLSRYHLATVAICDTLNIYSLINDGFNEIRLLAEKLEADIHAIEALLCLNSSLGVIIKNNNRLELNHISKTYLLSTSPFYWGPAFKRVYDSIEYIRLLKMFNKQKSHQPENGNDLTSMWITGSIDIETANNFTAIMHATISPAILNVINKNIFSDIGHLLDVGGGSGICLIEFMKKYPMKKATLFDLPTVCEVAKAYLKNEKLEKIINVHPGNFFKDDLPAADGILFSNIFHDWTVKQVKSLIQKAFNALPKGGKIFIHEMLLNEDKNGPVTPATFNLLMYLNHRSQQFTKNEIFTLLIDIGFVKCQKIKTHPYFSIIKAEKT
jgi:hypothetical protein